MTGLSTNSRIRTFGQVLTALSLFSIGYFSASIIQYDIRLKTEQMTAKLISKDTYRQRIENNTIIYDNVTWITPSSFRITCVVDATILHPSGLVFNKSQPFSFSKSYWVEDEYHIQLEPAHKKSFSVGYTLVQLHSQLFQHIILDALPRVVLSCKWLQSRPWIIIIIMNELMGELVREVCTLDQDRFYVLTRTEAFSSICVPYFEASDIQLGDVPSNSMTSLGSQTRVGDDIIYLPREKGTKRSVLNENDVLFTIRKVWPNVKVVYPVGDWKRDKKLFGNAKVIIGPHGGGLGNMIFAPKNTTIIEFLPLKSLKISNKIDRPCFLKLARALNFKYFAVEPKIFFDFHKPMVISIFELKNVLKVANASLF